jgi:hypothetical protein
MSCLLESVISIARFKIPWAISTFCSTGIELFPTFVFSLIIDEYLAIHNSVRYYVIGITSGIAGTEDIGDLFKSDFVSHAICEVLLGGLAAQFIIKVAALGNALLIECEDFLIGHHANTPKAIMAKSAVTRATSFPALQSWRRRAILLREAM